VPGPIGEVDLRQERVGASTRRRGRAAGQQGGQFDVLLRGELIHQEVRLEEEADLVPPEPRECAFGEFVDALPGDRQRTATRPVEPADQVQQRRFAAAARAHDRDGLAAIDVKVDRVERAHQALAAAVFLA
jgi:hypothetical protein